LAEATLPGVTLRRALITGAGSRDGIGFAAARLLAERGCRIAVTSTTARIHDRRDELRAMGADVTAHIADLTDAAAVARLAAEVGAVDILVNNAGMGSIGDPALQRPFLELSHQDWLHQIDTTLTTAVHVSRAFLPAMVAQAWGRVVMVSSVTGPVVSNPGDSAYSAAKAGMIGLTHALALEMAPCGITVNAVAPGWIGTGASTPAELSAARATPPGRAGTPCEVAACIGFLASQEASYVNGVTLVVDGGNALIETKGWGESSGSDDFGLSHSHL
jgi:3-oxoacyl-[acyl-carrier protein] reductase